MTASEPEAFGELEHEDAPPRRLIAKLSATLGVLLLLGAGVFLGYRWTQSQYYVYSSAGHVAIYQGIPQTVGPLHLSNVAELTDIQVQKLQPVAQDRLNTPITRGSLEAAQAVVGNLELLPDPPEPTEKPTTPGPSVSPSPTKASPSPSKESA